MSSGRQESTARCAGHHERPAQRQVWSSSRRHPSRSGRRAPAAAPRQRLKAYQRRGFRFIDSCTARSAGFAFCLSPGLTLLGVRPLALLALGLWNAAFRLSGPIGVPVSRNRDLLRRLLKEHLTDDTRQQLGKKVVEHLELSGFQIDEERQLMTKKRPPPHGHG